MNSLRLDGTILDAPITSRNASREMGTFSLIATVGLGKSIGSSRNLGCVLEEAPLSEKKVGVVVGILVVNGSKSCNNRVTISGVSTPNKGSSNGQVLLHFISGSQYV